MKRIIADEQIDAVIDAGDLLNFGSVAEAEAAGLFTSHRGPGRPLPLRPGQPRRQQRRRTGRCCSGWAGCATSSCSSRAAADYTAGHRQRRDASPASTTPAGSATTTATTRPSRRPPPRPSTAAYAGRPAPDVVVSHEPGAVEKVAAAGILVNGHLHTDQLEGNRIGVGTFTGGGTVSHFVQDAEKKRHRRPGELAGQPYAFDIAVFGQSCTLTSLTRYPYRNLIQGRPAYDDVQVINGSTIQPAAPGLHPLRAPRGRGSR